MSDDASLLRQYVTEGSETAFAELVHRHVDLVYSAAFRQVHGDPHRAQDATQVVFCELARNAPRLIGHRALSGWLYTAARFIGARVQRTELRRIIRERTSHTMIETQIKPASEPLWDELAPVLDDAMGSLSERDRTAIVLRFFENKPLAQVGAGIGLTENAARMRVERALERLRRVLQKRGIKSTTSVLGAVLAANAIVSAPTAIASTLVGPAIAGAVVSVTTFSGMISNLLYLMNSTKIALGVSAVAMATLMGTYVGMNNSNARLRSQVTALQKQLIPASIAQVRSALETNGDVEELARLRSEHGELMRLRGEVGVLRKTAADRSQNLREGSQIGGLTDEQVLALGQSQGFRELMGSAKMNYLRGWFMACQSFAQQNAGQWPENLEQAAGYFEPPKGWEWTAGLLVRNDFEIVYHGSVNSIEHPERTILVREKQPFDVRDGLGTRVARTYGFADGHQEVHISPDGNFDVWEHERMVASAP